MRNRAPLILILLILTISVVGGTFIFLRSRYPNLNLPGLNLPGMSQSSPEPTGTPDASLNPNLNTYENIKYGYSFQYPKNLVLRLGLGATDPSLATQLILDDPTRPGLLNADPDMPDSLKFLVKISATQILPDPPLNWKEETTTNKPYKYTRKYVSPDPDSDTFVYYLQFDKGGLVVDVKKEISPEVFDAIFSSFHYKSQPQPAKP